MITCDDGIRWDDFGHLLISRPAEDKLAQVPCRIYWFVLACLDPDVTWVPHDLTLLDQVERRSYVRRGDYTREEPRSQANPGANRVTSDAASTGLGQV